MKYKPDYVNTTSNTGITHVSAYNNIRWVPKEAV